MRISDWSSDVCSSDLEEVRLRKAEETIFEAPPIIDESGRCLDYSVDQRGLTWRRCYPVPFDQPKRESRRFLCPIRSAVTRGQQESSEEHTSELQSLMRISYAVFCLKKKQIQNQNI